MSNGIEILPLSRTPREILRFLKVSYRVYQRDPHWVAPLLSDLKRVFTDENPLFRHASMAFWVARKDGEDVGRIAGIIDHEANKKLETPEAAFGFFEAIQDGDVSHALFEAVQSWARQQGARRLLGPYNPTTNDECGLLVEGLDADPVFMMTYNPGYYVRQIEEEGFVKAKDLLAFMIDHKVIPMDRLRRIAAKVRQRNAEISFRPVRKKTLTSDLGRIKEVYNAAWEDNWGFLPMTDAEVDFMAARLKPLLMEGLVWLAETAERPIGFLLASPDFNVAIKPLRGKLLTPKILGFIPYLFGWKLPLRTRVLTLGVTRDYRGKGLESAMLIEGLDFGIGAGFTESEASWILEDNVMMCRVLETIGGRVYKRYRIYQKPL